LDALFLKSDKEMMFWEMFSGFIVSSSIYIRYYFKTKLGQNLDLFKDNFFLNKAVFKKSYLGDAGFSIDAARLFR